MARPKRPKRSNGDPESVKDYLKPYRISSRWTTFNGAFQAALCVPEMYDRAKAEEALALLGQPPKGSLTCVYCGAPAATWDHFNNTVRQGRFSGYGHRVFNLVPACRSCNESKGSKPWLEFIQSIDDPGRDARIKRLQAFAAKADREQFGWEQISREFPDEARRYDGLIKSLRALLDEGDALATTIREKVSVRLASEKRNVADPVEAPAAKK